MLDLDAIEARAHAATPGPWHNASARGTGVVHSKVAHCAIYLNVRGRGEEREADECVARWQRNAAFIASAREDVPALVAGLRAARSALAAVTSERDTLKIDLACAHGREMLANEGHNAAIAERNAARAEVERVRAEVATYAAEAVQRERADVVAWLRARDDWAGDSADSYARRIEQGAHVGAAKGGEHG